MTPRWPRWLARASVVAYYELLHPSWQFYVFIGVILKASARSADEDTRARDAADRGEAAGDAGRVVLPGTGARDVLRARRVGELLRRASSGGWRL